LSRQQRLAGSCLLGVKWFVPFVRPSTSVFQTKSMANDDARALLKACIQNATERLNRTCKTAEEIGELLGRLNVEEKDKLRAMYGRTVLVGVGVTAVAFGIATPRRRFPFVSAAVASTFGSMAAVLDVGERMPKLLLEMAASTDPNSPVADELVCPAVLEFEPCAQDTRCHELMRAGQRSAPLLDCLESCRARAALLRERYSQQMGEGLAASEVESSGLITPPSSVDGMNVAHAQGPSDDLLAPSARVDGDDIQRSFTDHRSPAPPASSWDAVRARHLAGQATSSHATAGGEGQTNSENGGLLAPEEPAGGAAAGPAEGLQAAAQPQAAVARGRKNAYGDDVM